MCFDIVVFRIASNGIRSTACFNVDFLVFFFCIFLSKKKKYNLISR